MTSKYLLRKVNAIATSNLLLVTAQRLMLVFFIPSVADLYAFITRISWCWSWLKLGHSFCILMRWPYFNRFIFTENIFQNILTYKYYFLKKINMIKLCIKIYIKMIYFKKSFNVLIFISTYIINTNFQNECWWKF